PPSPFVGGELCLPSVGPFGGLWTGAQATIARNPVPSVIIHKELERMIITSPCNGGRPTPETRGLLVGTNALLGPSTIRALHVAFVSSLGNIERSPPPAPAPGGERTPRASYMPCAGPTRRIPLYQAVRVDLARVLLVR